MQEIKLLGANDPYFKSERFLTHGYWEAKWKARQYWFEQEALLAEREALFEQRKLVMEAKRKNQRWQKTGDST